MHTDYPQSKMEWIVVDDGEDCVEDLFKGVPCVKYHRVEEKMKLLTPTETHADIKDRLTTVLFW